MVTLHWLHKVTPATEPILSPFPSHALQHFLTMGRVNSGYFEQESNFMHVFRLEPKINKIVQMSYTSFFVQKCAYVFDVWLSLPFHRVL